jgi:transposase
MAYSIDFRERVLGYLTEGHTQAEASKVFKVGTTAIKGWKKLLVETGGLQIRVPKREGWVYDSERLRIFVKEHPQAYLREIAEHFGGSVMGAANALAREKITLKKGR